MYFIALFTDISLILWTAILFLLFIYFKWKSNYWERRGVKGPKSYPLIGTLWEHFLLPNNLLEERRFQRYGRVYGAMQGWKPILTIGEPELIKQIRITDFRTFINHREVLSGHRLMAKMLIELKDDEWKRVRNIISPVFSTGKLKKMQPMLETCINNTLQYLEKVAKEEIEVDLKKVMMSYTMDTIAICAFAMETAGYKDPNNEFLRKAADLNTLRLWRLLTTFTLPTKIQTLLGIHLLPGHLVEYFVNVIKSVIKQRREKKQKINDFVQLMLDAELSKEDTTSNTRRKLTDEELTAQCFLFFLVGYETSSTLLQFTLYALAMHPKIQQKLFEEIRTYFDNNKTPDYDSLMALPYFDAVINETLRLYTPVPLFEQVCSDDYKLGDTGITIEKGTLINLPYYAMHHDPELFPFPNEFKPERFLPENKDQIKPYSFNPFGAGPRMCIAMRFASFNSRLFLANLINQFEVLRTENTMSTPIFTGTYDLLDCKPLIAKFIKRK